MHLRKPREDGDRRNHCDVTHKRSSILSMATRTELNHIKGITVHSGTIIMNSNFKATDTVLFVRSSVFYTLPLSSCTVLGFIIIIIIIISPLLKVTTTTTICH